MLHIVVYLSYVISYPVYDLCMQNDTLKFTESNASEFFFFKLRCIFICNLINSYRSITFNLKNTHDTNEI